MNILDVSNSPSERDSMILRALAAGQFAFGRNEAAIDFLELARLIDPENHEICVMMSRIYYASKNTEEAFSWITLARELCNDELSHRDQVFERRIRLLIEINKPTNVLN